jgi:stage V sporulation protein B
VLGFIFRIFLSRALGAETMGIYSIGLSVYFAALTLTGGGLPLVVSRKTSAFRAAGDFRARNSTVSASLALGLAASAVVAAVFLILSLFIGNLFSDGRLSVLLILLLPSVAATAVHSSFYGALWGDRKYFAVSLIELIEQLLRITCCLAMIWLFKNFDAVYSATLSLSISCAGGAAAAAAVYFSGGGKASGAKGFLKPLLRETAPITGMRLTGSLVNGVISVLMPLILAFETGVTKGEAVAAFGTSVGMALPLLFLPSTIIGSLAVALVPELSAKIQRKDFAGARKEVERSVLFSIAVCALSTPLFYAAGNPLGLFLYNNAEVGRYLAGAAWIMLPVSLEQITSSMMNSLGLELQSYRNYCVTVPLMLVCLLALPYFIGMNAYFVSLGAACGVQTLLHIWDMRKKIGLDCSFARPLLAGVAAIAVASAAGRLAGLLTDMLPLWLHIALVCAAALLCAGILCAAFGLLPVGKGRFLRKFPPRRAVKAAAARSFFGFF